MYVVSGLVLAVCAIFLAPGVEAGTITDEPAEECKGSCTPGDGSCAETEACVNGKCCPKPKEADLDQCSNVTGIGMAFVIDEGCLNLFLRAADSTASQQDKCKGFWDGLKCAAGVLFPVSEINARRCFEKVKEKVGRDAEEVKTEIRNQFDLDLGAFDPLDCDDDPNEGCKGSCNPGARDTCAEKEVCLRGMCCPKPMEGDFDQCKNVSVIGKTATSDLSCGVVFATLLQEDKTQAEYCRAFWGGLNCVTEKLYTDAQDRNKCRQYMKEAVKEDPDGIRNQIAAQFNVQIPDFDPLNCGELCPGSEVIVDLLQGGKCRMQVLRMGPAVASASQEERCKALKEVAKCVVDGLDEDSGNCMEALHDAIQTYLLTNAISPPQCEADPEPKCTTIAEIIASANKCKEKFADIESSAVTKQCKAFTTGIECLAEELDAENERDCMSNIFRILRTRGQATSFLTRLATSLGMTRLRNFNFAQCSDLPCGDQDPLQGVTCSASQACPNNALCNKGVCCPQRRPGKCPENIRSGSYAYACNKKCSADGNCGPDEKCCQHPCGLVCVKAEEEGQSGCQRALSDALSNIDVCMNKLSWVPRCHGDDWFPTQGFDNGLNWCVDPEDGSKVPGSDFREATNCSKVHEGQCPRPTRSCNSRTEGLEMLCHSDDECHTDQKCCYVSEGNRCGRICKASEPVTDTTTLPPAAECPGEEEPACCKRTLCVGQVCASDPRARCEVDSCGSCSIKWTNEKGEAVDCLKGVTLCERRRAEGLGKLADLIPDRLKLARMYHLNSDMPEGPTGAGDEREGDMDEFKRYDDMEGDRESDEMEGGAMSRGGVMEREEMEKPTPEEICQRMDRMGACKNGGICKLDLEKFQLCDCSGTDHYGLFCNKPGAPTPDTQCTHISARVQQIRGYIQSGQPAEQLVMMALSHAPAGMVIPKLSCDANGQFSQKQCGFSLSRLDQTFCYCVDTVTGQMKEKSDRAESTQDLDCSKDSEFYDLPLKCLLKEDVGPCKAAIPQWHYDTASKSCKMFTYGGCKGNDNRFSSPTLCYHHCMGENAKPPCDNCDYEENYCVVPRETDTTVAESTPECTSYPAHCLMEKAEGTGENLTRAWYFNKGDGKCERFVYNGHDGNLNRFRTKHQCQTECGVKESKTSGVVCPDPKKFLMMMMMGMSGEGPIQDYPDMCSDDTDCVAADGIVRHCCSNGMARVCSPAISSYCESGERCSYYGSCVTSLAGDQCECPNICTLDYSPVCGTDGKSWKTFSNKCGMEAYACQQNVYWTKMFEGECSDQCEDGGKECQGIYRDCSSGSCQCLDVCTADYTPVCGSDGVTYSNECRLRLKACYTISPIWVVYEGECAEDSPPPLDCACTEEYDPVCVVATLASGAETEMTYSNPCTAKSAPKCEDNVLTVSKKHDGACNADNSACGSTCEPYQQCEEDGTCGCPSMCPAVYKPICATPKDDASSEKDFSNECTMWLYGCQNQMEMVVKHPGKCEDGKDTQPMCPKRVDLAPALRAVCNVGTAASAAVQCSEGQKCCQYDSQSLCVGDDELVREVMKPGQCPVLTSVSIPDPDSQCMESQECQEDSDCGGENAKCCSNPVCGGSTCAVSIEYNDEEVCGQGNAIFYPSCDSDSESPLCPMNSKCTTSTVGERTVSMCCGTKDDLEKQPKEEIQRVKRCSALAMLGLGCQNGGMCLANFQDGIMCQCKAGFYGHLCEKSVAQCEDKIVMCVDDPCNTAKCDELKGVECQTNYCGGCNARWIHSATGYDVSYKCKAYSCRQQKSFNLWLMMKMRQEDMMADGETTQSEDSEAGTNTARSENDESENGDNDNDEDGDEDRERESPFGMNLYRTLMALRVTKIRSHVTCTSDGMYDREQCVSYLATRRTVCGCVKPDGEHFPDSPIARQPDQLKCSLLDSDLPRRCLLPPETGMCRAYLERWYYNQTEESCKMFIYGGCGGNKNNFADRDSCTQFCSSKDVPLEACKTLSCEQDKVCRLDVDGNAACVDDSKPSVPRLPFVASCDDDGKFSPRQCHGDSCFCVDRETGDFVAGTMASGDNLQCTPREEVCNGPIVPCVVAPCQVTQCSNYPRATCKNSYCGSCKALFYDGEEEVTDMCKPASDPRCPEVKADTVGTCVEGCPKEGCPAGTICCSNGCGHVCTEPEVQCPEGVPTVGCARDPCDGASCLTYPEAKCWTNTCGQCSAQFWHKNRDVTAECSKVCFLKPEVGPCEALIPSWYFDEQSNFCKEFNYGGCDGNKNRFSTLADCNKHCGNVAKCKNGSPLPNISCRTERCPANYSCNVHPSDMYTVCCKDDEEKTVVPVVTKQKMCPGQTQPPRPCLEAGQDPCNNCQPTGQGNDNNDDDTPCSCPTCPGGQRRKQCPDSCRHSTCPTFQGANCIVDPCTCAVQFMTHDDEAVDCTKRPASCQIQRNNAQSTNRKYELQQIVPGNNAGGRGNAARGNDNSGRGQDNGGDGQDNGGDGQDNGADSRDNAAVVTLVDVPSCDGRFFDAVQCSADQQTCWCANPNTGEAVDNTRVTGTGNQRPQMNCEEQKQKKAGKQAKVKTKLSKTRSIDILTENDKSSIKEDFAQFVKTKTGLDAKEIKLRSGSIILESLVECNDNTCTESDIVTDTNTLFVELAEGAFQPALEDGTTLESAEPELVEFVPEEQVGPSTSKPPDDKDDNKKTIIIVVVVVVVVVIIAIVVLYACIRTRRKKTNKDIQFDNLEGHSNPTYK